MKYKKLYDGQEVSVLGMGTARIPADGSRDQAVISALRAGIERGMTHIDTAEVYGDGHAEWLVGEAAAVLRRGDVFITTKVSDEHLRYGQVLAALTQSLQRLRTNYVDLYLIHAPNPNVPLAETFRALNEVVADGHVRYLGVSNFSVEQMEEAQRHSHLPLATNQVHYSVLHRAPERDGVLEYCRQHGMLLTAYSPLEVGEALGNEDLARVAARHGATPSQVALAWLIRQPQVIAIPMSLDAQHIAENAGALDLELSDEDLAELAGPEGR